MVIVIYWVTFPLQIPLLVILSKCLNFIGIFICVNTDLHIEISLYILKVFPAGLEKCIVKSRNCIVSSHRLEQLP